MIKNLHTAWRRCAGFFVSSLQSICKTQVYYYTKNCLTRYFFYFIHNYILILVYYLNQNKRRSNIKKPNGYNCFNL